MLNLARRLRRAKNYYYSNCLSYFTLPCTYCTNGPKLGCHVVEKKERVVLEGRLGVEYEVHNRLVFYESPAVNETSAGISVFSCPSHYNILRFLPRLDMELQDENDRYIFFRLASPWLTSFE